jgi:DNA-binding transcriptional LysR family regulator
MQWTERIGRRINLRDLHILLAVAQTGSMSRAADRLAISHPVVSKTIADLEHALNVRLLDRTPQGTEPTAYGRAVLSCSTTVFDELRRVVQQIAFLSDPTTGAAAARERPPFRRHPRTGADHELQRE